MSYDLLKNFAYSTIAVAPVPAASGTAFSVAAGEGALFPAVSFNAVVWPAGANPLSTNAEIVRVTNKGTGDNWTATRVTESSSARSIAVGDQIMAAITAKTFTDIQADVTTHNTGLIPGGRLSLTTVVPVTSSDVTAATTLYYTPYHHDAVSLYDGSATWNRRTFTELSIAVPATTSQVYDVFAYDNAGVPALELLAWTNDTTRATALARQNGHLVKSGTTTRLYVGSMRTTTVSGQTEDSAAKRYLYNYYNRVERGLQAAFDTTDSWNYTTDTWRQANNNAVVQLDVVVGWNEDNINIQAICEGSNSTGGGTFRIGVGENSVTTLATGTIHNNSVSTVRTALFANLRKVPAVGRNFYASIEKSTASGTTTFYGDDGTLCQTGISGTFRM